EAGGGVVGVAVGDHAPGRPAVLVLIDPGQHVPRPGGRVRAGHAVVIGGDVVGVTGRAELAHVDRMTGHRLHAGVAVGGRLPLRRVEVELVHQVAVRVQGADPAEVGGIGEALRRHDVGGPRGPDGVQQPLHSG